jgi:hypothetical protein
VATLAQAGPATASVRGPAAPMVRWPLTVAVLLLVFGDGTQSPKPPKVVYCDPVRAVRIATIGAKATTKQLGGGKFGTIGGKVCGANNIFKPDGKMAGLGYQDYHRGLPMWKGAYVTACLRVDFGSSEWYHSSSAL